MLIQIVEDNNLSLEVDAVRIASTRSFFESIDERDENTQAQQNSRKLMRVAGALMDRMMVDGEDIDRIPPALFDVVHYGWMEVARNGSTLEHLQGHFHQLLARLFCPVVASPYDWFARMPRPEASAQRNLVLLSKLIQNCILGIEFGPSEPALVHCNTFVAAYGDRWRHFLLTLVHHEQMASSSAGHYADACADLTRHLSHTVLVDVALQDLVRLHDMLVSNSATLLPYLSSLRSMGDMSASVKPGPLGDSRSSTRSLPSLEDDDLSITESSGRSSEPDPPIERCDAPLPPSRRATLPSGHAHAVQDFLALLTEMGPAPLHWRCGNEPTSAASSSSLSSAPAPPANPLNNLAAVPPTGSAPMVPLRTSESPTNPPTTPPSSSLEVDVGERLASARFVYEGMVDRQGRRSVYVVMERLTEELLGNIDVLMQHLAGVFEAVLAAGNYVLVLDFSWSNPSADMRALLLRTWSQLEVMFDSRFRKQLQAVYVVHPNDFSKWALKQLRVAVRGKPKPGSPCVELIAEWTQLLQVFEPANLRLAEAAQDCFGLVYNVNKVNAKGKVQHRWIKFTPVSLLNIDSKSRHVRNEKLIASIDEVVISTNSPDLILYFSVDSARSSASKPSSTASSLGGVASSSTSSSTASSALAEVRPMLMHTSPVTGPRSNRKSVLQRMRTSAADAACRRYAFFSMADRDRVVMEIISRCFYRTAAAWEFPIEYRVSAVDVKLRAVSYMITSDALLELDPSMRILAEISYAGIRAASLALDRDRVVRFEVKAEREPRRLLCESESQARRLFGALQAILSPSHARMPLLASALPLGAPADSDDSSLSCEEPDLDATLVPMVVQNY